MAFGLLWLFNANIYIYIYIVCLFVCLVVVNILGIIKGHLSLRDLLFL